MDTYTHASESHRTDPADPNVVAEAMSGERAEACRRKLTMIVIVFLAAGLVAALSVTANGQGAKYDAMDMHKAFSDPSIMRRMEAAAKEVAQKKDLSTVREPSFARAFYLNYVPAKLTQPDGLAEISELTQDVMKNLSSAQRSNNPGARQIVEWLYTGMKKVAEGNYQPAARINALSILGRLDSRPANTTAKSPPVPYAQTFPVLLAAYQKESNPDGVRAAALKGLHRFVSIGFPALNDQQKTQVATAMQQLLDADVPEGRDRIAHAYLQRFAVDILSVLEPDQGGQLGEQLVSISVEPTRHDLIALYSVSKLAGVRNLATVAENPEPLLDQWTVRAMRAFQYEYARLELLDGIGQASKQPPKPEQTVIKRQDQSSFVPGSYNEDYDEDDGSDEGSYDEGDYEDEGMEDYDDEDDGTGYFAVAANPQPPEVLASRRRLNHVLQQIHRGVTGSGKAGNPSRPGGLLAVVKDDKKTKIEDWVEDMESLVNDLNDPLNDDRAKFKVALLLQIETIKEIAGAAGEEAAAEFAKLPHGINPYAKLAILSGEPLEKAKEVVPVAVPADQPADPPVADPEAAAKPPAGAAASTPVPASAGT